MSDEKIKKRKKISTSALMTKHQEAEVLKHMEEIEKAQAEAQAQIAADPNSTPSAALRPKVAPWTKSEPLTKIHSILGHIAQGDIYRNELDLVYDRLTGDAEAPEYVPSEIDEKADDAFEPIVSRGADPWSSEQFSFGESSGSVSFGESSGSVSFGESSGSVSFGESSGSVSVETNQASPSPTLEREDSGQILDGVNLDDFDQLHQSAKSSGMLTQNDVDVFLDKSKPALSDHELGLLSGAQEPSIEELEEHNIADPFAVSSDLPKRERGLQHNQEAFFTQNDTFSEINFNTSSETEGGEQDSESRSAVEPEADKPVNNFLLGDAEDTIVD